MEKEAAFKLIREFARNQVQITHQANSRRGVTNKAIREENNLVKNLIEGLCNDHCTEDEIKELINSLS